MLTEMSDRSSLSDSAVDILWLILYTVTFVVVVLVVDSLALLLLNLQTDVGTWVPLLMSEAFIMMLFGVAGWGVKEFQHIPVGWRETHIIHLRLTPRHPWFWLSLGMAGVVLIIICAYLVARFYGI
jgi:hypothetical protein